MKQYGPIPLFDNYITLVLKTKKTEINIKINTDLVMQLGYSYINSTKSNPRAIRDFANYLATEKRFDEALKIYENLLKIKTNAETQSSIYFSYGQMLLGQAMVLEPSSMDRVKTLKEAEEKFRKAFEINKLHYMALVFLSITLKEKGEVEEARKELERAERIAEEFKKVKKEKFSHGEIPYKIGVFYLEFNRYEDAIYWLKIACNKEPENFANWWRLGYAKKKYALLLKEQSRGEYKKFLEEALSDLEMSWEKAPELLQLPASEEIPNLIVECKKHLQNDAEEN
jgi:tetratricopeptide (TPR) repeat protein